MYALCLSCVNIFLSHHCSYDLLLLCMQPIIVWETLTGVDTIRNKLIVVPILQGRVLHQGLKRGLECPTYISQEGSKMHVVYK